MMNDFFFSGWETVGRTFAIGILAYAGLILLLRISGRRTLSKMNAFDFVVTVAFGSTLATILLNKDVALVEGLTAFAVLVGLQFVVTWTSVRVTWFRRIVTGEPRLLLHEGEFLRAAMRAARVAEDEIHAALRSEGVADPREALAVVLETDGSFSVIRKNERVGRGSLENIGGA
jgi:uncharacterized membrane protein YcaP (DUF421 family)